jgi:hypothetical protein
MSMANSNDTFRNQTRDHPACSAASQPVAPRVPPGLYEIHKQIILVIAEILMLWYVEGTLTGIVYSASVICYPLR